jgi:VWFA-related protein
MILFRFPLSASKKSFLRAGLSFFLLSLFLSAAQVSHAQDADDVVRVETNLVQLNVGVVDRQGRAILNLSQGDFAVYEEGVRQSIQSFEPTTTPFSLVLLLDMSGSTKSFRQTLKLSALRFIDALAPDDRVAVISFNKKVEMLTPGFTTDRGKIAYAIEIADGGGETEFYKALNYSLEQLAKEQKRRKAIIVLTDGIDTQMRNADRASAVRAQAQTDTDAIASIKPDASPALNSVLNAADRQGVTVYPLALPSGDPKRLPLPDPVITAIYTSARTRMQMLADRTGGRLNEIRRLEDMGRLYAEVAAELRTLYTIAYQPSGPQTQKKGWRDIRIEVTRSELIARTRPGYHAR